MDKVDKINYFTTRSRFPAMVFPMIWYHSYLSSDRLLKDFNVKVDKAGMLIDNGKRRDFFYPLDKALELKRNALIKVLNEEDYLSLYEKSFADECKEFLQYIREREKINTRFISDKELFEIYEQYNNMFKELNYPALVIIVFIIDELIDKIREVIPDPRDIEVLTKTEKLPYLLEYELDILTHSIKDAERLHQEWYWIPFDYYGADEWQIDHFREELKKKKDPERLSYLKDYSHNTKLDQDKILSKYTLNTNQKRLIKYLQIISFIQDERKRVTNISYPFLQKSIITEFSKRTGISKELLWLMTPDEIKSALKGNIKEIKHRRISCAIEIRGDNFVIHEEIPAFLQSRNDNTTHVDEIKGFPASQGVVKGIVRICKTSIDTKSINEGEIMVAPCTTPDYILGFQKASAVVTDEGGITSHAAVISREMKLPCVVGTKNATEILHNGDLVEVNGAKGTVKILKRKQNAP